MASLPASSLAWAALAALALLPAAAAQTTSPTDATADDGCTQSSPCPLDVGVDDKGFTDVPLDVVTSGDWYEVTVVNEGEVAHTVTLSGTSLKLAVDVDDLQSQVIQFGDPACLEFKDAPSGATHTLRVVAGDSVDYAQGATSGDPCAKKSPSATVPLLGMGLLAVAAVARRFG